MSAVKINALFSATEGSALVKRMNALLLEHTKDHPELVEALKIVPKPAKAEKKPVEGSSSDEKKPAKSSEPTEGHLKVDDDFREGLLKFVAHLLVSAGKNVHKAGPSTKTLSSAAFEDALFTTFKDAPETFRKAWNASASATNDELRRKKEEDDLRKEENKKLKEANKELPKREKKAASSSDSDSDADVTVARFTSSFKNFVGTAAIDPANKDKPKVSEELVYRFSYAVDHFLQILAAKLTEQLAFAATTFGSGVCFRKRGFAISWAWIYSALLAEESKAMMEANFDDVFKEIAQGLTLKKEEAARKKKEKPAASKGQDESMATADTEAADEDADEEEVSSAKKKPKAKKETSDDEPASSEKKPKAKKEKSGDEPASSEKKEKKEKKSKE